MNFCKKDTGVFKIFDIFFLTLQRKLLVLLEKINARRQTFSETVKEMRKYKVKKEELRR